MRRLERVLVDVVVTMTLGQSLMIVEAKDNGSQCQDEEERPKAGVLWYIQISSHDGKRLQSLSVVKLVNVLSPWLPDNTCNEDAAVAAHSETFERPATPIAAQLDFEVLAKQVAFIRGS